MILRSTLPEFKDKYTVELNESQKKAADRLLRALKDSVAGQKDGEEFTHVLSVDHPNCCALGLEADLVWVIHRFSFKMVTTSSPSVDLDEFRCPLLQFVILLHCDEDKSIAPPTSITPTLAQLTAGIRVVIYMHIHFESVKPDARPSLE